MKRLLFSCTLPLLATLAAAQDAAVPKEVPAETVKKAAPAAWLGIAMEENDGRVIVSAVIDGSPAAKAGLKRGDVIAGIDKLKVESDVTAVARYVGERKPGDTVTLRFKREDSDKSTDIELAERPALDGEFRGEFHHAEDSEPRKKSRSEDDGNDDAHGKPHGKAGGGEKGGDSDDDKDPPGKSFREKERREERAAGSEKQEAREEMQKRVREMKQLQREYGKLLRPGKPDPAHPAPLLRWYLDQQWPGDPDKSAPEWRPLLKRALPDPWKQQQENAVWKKVERSVGRALKESGLGPDVIEKAMEAVASARKQGDEQNSRRAKLEAEAARLEKEMQALKEKAGRIREELNKADD